jgi:hypothetical protein
MWAIPTGTLRLAFFFLAAAPVAVDDAAEDFASVSATIPLPFSI